jgi:hypothetical protein
MPLTRHQIVGKASGFEGVTKNCTIPVNAPSIMALRTRLINQPS